jgi:hypothetical protein
MPLMSSKIFLWWKLILTLGLFLWPGSTLLAIPPPSIQLPVLDFNFGEIEEGSVLSHDFLVRNTGSGILEIADVQPG